MATLNINTISGEQSYVISSTPSSTCPNLAIRTSSGVQYAPLYDRPSGKVAVYTGCVCGSTNPIRYLDGPGWQLVWECKVCASTVTSTRCICATVCSDWLANCSSLKVEIDGKAGVNLPFTAGIWNQDVDCVKMMTTNTSSTQFYVVDSRYYKPCSCWEITACLCCSFSCAFAYCPSHESMRQCMPGNITDPFTTAGIAMKCGNYVFTAMNGMNYKTGTGTFGPHLWVCYKWNAYGFSCATIGASCTINVKSSVTSGCCSTCHLCPASIESLSGKKTILTMNCSANSQICFALYCGNSICCGSQRSPAYWWDSGGYLLQCAACSCGIGNITWDNFLCRSSMYYRCFCSSYHTFYAQNLYQTVPGDTTNLKTGKMSTSGGICVACWKLQKCIICLDPYDIPPSIQCSSRACPWCWQIDRTYQAQMSQTGCPWNFRNMEDCFIMRIYAWRQ